ncbi:MAG: hypothetical protein MUO63_08830 [Desulfobulbaceae bacterium]|nr:hypothetical protein [Desulfobulbaceae bacterium]
MTICKLCKTDQVLRNSHIIPEFLYAKLYNEKHKLLGIHGIGKHGCQLLQKGISEPLFCESCEQHFNEYYEKPFLKQWVENSHLPDPWSVNGIHWINVEYSSFKLFHLSVLFRASVSTLPTFHSVSLGPHEEKLRKLLLTRSPGKDWQYPVFAYCVMHHKTKNIIQMVTQPQQSKFYGRRCYGTMYGGAMWWVCVASHRNIEFEKVALQPDGNMPFTAVPWNEVSVVQQASQALKNARS